MLVCRAQICTWIVAISSLQVSDHRIYLGLQEVWEKNHADNLPDYKLPGLKGNNKEIRISQCLIEIGM